MSVIANTTVISNFASINQLDLLRRLFGALYISTEVYEEIRIGLEEGYPSMFKFSGGRPGSSPGYRPAGSPRGCVVVGCRRYTPAVCSPGGLVGADDRGGREQAADSGSGCGLIRLRRATVVQISSCGFETNSPSVSVLGLGRLDITLMFRSEQIFETYWI
jgi:hypothetical protein